MSPTDCLGVPWHALTARVEPADTLARWARAEPALAEFGCLNDVARMLHHGDDVERGDQVLGALVRLAAVDGGDEEDAALLVAHLLANGSRKLALELRDLSDDIDDLIAGALWLRIRMFPWRQRSRAYAKSLLLDTRKAVLAELHPYRSPDGRERVVPVDPSPAPAGPAGPGGMAGLFGGKGAQAGGADAAGSGAATRHDGQGRSQGESSADSVTQSRFASMAAGMSPIGTALQNGATAISGVAGKATAIGADVLGAAGVGHQAPYFGQGSSDPTGCGGTGSTPSGGTGTDRSGPNGDTTAGGGTPMPPTPPMPPMPPMPPVPPMPQPPTPTPSGGGGAGDPGGSAAGSGSAGGAGEAGAAGGVGEVPIVPV